MYKLHVFVPSSHLEQVKQALFNVGAGKVGNYDSCCWQTLGSGEFRPLAGSTPFIGQQGSIETVQEFKVEMVCAEQLIDQAIKALRDAHPYEEPAFDIIKLEDI